MRISSRSEHSGFLFQKAAFTRILCLSFWKHQEPLEALFWLGTESQEWFWTLLLHFLHHEAWGWMAGVGSGCSPGPFNPDAHSSHAVFWVLLSRLPLESGVLLTILSDNNSKPSLPCRWLGSQGKCWKSSKVMIVMQFRIWDPCRISGIENSLFHTYMMPNTFPKAFSAEVA